MQETLRLARTTANELRPRGGQDRAKAIEALVAAASDEAVPALDVLTSTEAEDLLGATGQTIKNWVRQRRLVGYRLGGRIMVPKDGIANDVRRARGSLDLEEVFDEDAARLVAEGWQSR